MELKLEVLSSVSIKRKKPWPRFAWLGEPPSSYGLFLLDANRISQLSLGTGKTKRSISSLAPIQPRIALATSSPNGAYLGGLTTTGELFTWRKATEILETFRIPHGRGLRETPDKPAPLHQDFQGYRLFLSDSGEQALLVTSRHELYLWEVDGDGSPQWWSIVPPGVAPLPQPSYRETSVEACFFVDAALGECCSCVFAFTSREAPRQTLITHLLIRWNSAIEQFYAAHSNIATEDPSHGESTAGRVIPLSVDGAPVISPPILLQENATGSSIMKDAVRGGKSLQPSQRGPGSRDEPLRDRTNVLEDREAMVCEQSPASPSPVIPSPHGHEYQEVPQTAQVPTSASNSGDSEEPRKATNRDVTDMPPFQTFWRTGTCRAEGKDVSQRSSLTGRGSYVLKFSLTGNVMALAMNKELAADTQVLFLSPLTECGLACPVYQFRDKEKAGRTYWVSDLAWTADGLLLACVTRRGSLLLLPRFGQPLRLVTRGCFLDMGPSLSLPLHPLITVVGAAAIDHNVTNHETSQSSERDALRQRFSVATHPHLPVLLCSDGYSVTVLRLEEGGGGGGTLSQLVGGLVADARKKLGLPPLLEDEVSPGGRDRDGCGSGSESFGTECRPVEGRNQLQTPFKSLLSNELSCIVRGSELDGTLASTLTASGTGFGLLMGLSGMESGAIHFAGMDSHLDQTSCSVLDKTLREKHSTEQAISELHTAWGLLLSASELEPGNGLYPRERPLTLTEITTCQSSLRFSSSTLILTLVSNATAGAYAQRRPYLNPVRLLNGTADSAASALSLVALDSIKQGCLSLTVSLANAASLVLLSECLREHRSFLSRKRHNLQSLREFAESVTASVTALGGFLTDVISLLSSTYNPSNLLSQPSLLAGNFDPPRLPDGQGSRLTAVAQLQASLSSVADMARIFRKDIKRCSSAARKILPRKATTNVLQLREFGLLYKSLVSSVRQASSVLRSTHAGVTSILQHLGTGEPAADEKRQLDVSAERLYLEGGLERALESFDQKRGHSAVEDGNPITSEQCGAAATPHIHAVTSQLGPTFSTDLAILFVKLERYELKSTLEFARSFIVNCPQKGALGQAVPPAQEARSATAPPRPSSAIGATGKAKAGVGISRSRSWASLYQGKASSSLPPLTGDPDSSVFHQLPAEGDSPLKTMMFIESENGLAVVTSLARFMTAFFCNWPLLVAPATNPSIIPPASSQAPLTNSRYLELDRSVITKSIRQQSLSDEWTVDHALELLLLSGLWEEACDLVSSLGDWKKSFLLASTHLTHAKKLAEVTGNLPGESHPGLEVIAHHLAVGNIMGLLVSPQGSTSPYSSSSGVSQPLKHSETPKRPNRQAARLATEERRASRACRTGTGAEGTRPHSVEVLNAVSSTLRACAWVELDSVLMGTVGSLLGRLTETCKRLSLEVPVSVYLPAPPLYCPQPSITQEEFLQCPGELSLRGKIAVLVRDLLALLSASYCVQPCIQWYAHRLRELQARAETEEELDCLAPPRRATWGVSSSHDSAQSLSQRAREGFSFLHPDQDRAEELPLSVQFLLAAFRQLCGLLWLLHVRDRASSCGRKLHPSPPLRNPPRDARVCEEAATWCTKLLPFSDFLLPEQRKNSLAVEDLVLSVLSELPCGAFAADLLAHSFPGANFEENRSLNAKMKRLLTRLRSTADVTDSLADDNGRGSVQPEPLSVRYQAASRRMLDAQRESLGTKADKFQVLVTKASSSSSDPVAASALEVGSFLHEYDEDFVGFLDTLFSVICPGEDSQRPSSSSRGSRQLAGEPRPHPYLGHYCSMVVAHADPTALLTGWEQVIPLLTRLSDWSQSGTASGSHSTITQRHSVSISEFGTSWNGGKSRRLLEPSQTQKKASAIRRRKPSKSGGLRGSAMRVNLSPPFIINCLRVREESEVRRTVKKPATRTPATLPLTVTTSAPPSPLPFARSEHELVSSNRSLHLADLERSTADATVESSDTQRGRVEAARRDVSGLGDQSALDLKVTEGEDEDGSLGVCLPLLWVPEGVLHGQLPTLAVKSLIEGDGSPIKAPRSKKFPSLEPLRVGGVDTGFPDPKPPSPSPEHMTESFSTGEVPSPVTFSVGEFGSRVRAEDTLTQTTDFAATLEQLPDQDGLLATLTPGFLQEAVTEESPHPERDSGGDKEAATTTSTDTNEQVDTQQGGAESGGGGGSEEQGERSGSSGLGDEGGGGDDGDRSGSDGGTTEVTPSDSEESHSSSATVPSSQQSAPAGTSEKRGGHDQELSSRAEDITRDHAARNFLRTREDSPVVSKQTAAIPPDPASQLPPPHLIPTTAATATPVQPSLLYHPGIPPLAPPLAPPTQPRPPHRPDIPPLAPPLAPPTHNRGRHVSGTSMATTITTDFSDGPLPSHFQEGARPQAQTGGLPAPLKGLLAPEGPPKGLPAPEGLPAQEGPPKGLPAPEGLPAAQESSVTTGSTEEEMRLLGYRSRTGPLQSTAIRGGRAAVGAPQRARTDGTLPRRTALPSEHHQTQDRPGIGPSELEGMIPRLGETEREGPGDTSREGDSREGESADGGRKDGRRREGEGRLATRESIGKIVKHEMKKILKLQHEHLLGLLEATPTRDTAQLLQMEPTSPVQDRPGMGTQDSAHDDSMAPLLNLNDLQSTLVPDQPTHVTILILPTQSETNLQLEAQENPELPDQELAGATPHVEVEAGARTGTGTIEAGAGTGNMEDGAGTGNMEAGAGTMETGARTGDKREDNQFGTQGSKPDPPTHSKSYSGDLMLSDLASEPRSPGAFLPFSSSNFSTTVPTEKSSVAAGEPEKTRISRESFRGNGPFSQIRLTGMCGQMPLLQLGALQLEAPGGVTNRRPAPLNLRQEYPHLTKCLTQFNNSVTQTRFPYKDSRVGGRPQSQAPPTQTMSAIPLLSVADLGPSKPPQSAPPYNFTVEPLPSGPKTLPLLHLPSEAYTLPGMVPPPEAPHAHRSSERERHMFPAQAKPEAKETDTSQRQPLPLLTLQSQVHQHQSNTPTHPPPLQPPPPPPSHPSGYTCRLPQVPIRPFFPRLIPPDVIQRQQQLGSEFPLLELQDPLSKMKQKGFKLLRLPGEPETSAPPELLHGDQSRPTVLPHLPTFLPPPVDSGSHKAEAKSERTEMVEDVSAEKSDHATAEEEPGSGGDTVQEKQQSRVRRRRRRERHISWKGDRDSEDSEEPVGNGEKIRFKTTKAPEMQLRRDSTSESHSDHETVVPTPVSAKPPESEPGSSHMKDLSSPEIQTHQNEAQRHLQPPEIPTSQPSVTSQSSVPSQPSVTSQPGVTPLERLELRRLEMNALYVPSASSGEERESAASGFQTASESDRATQVPAAGAGVDRAVRVQLPSLGSEAADTGRPFPVVDVERVGLLLRPEGWGAAKGGGHQFISVVDIREEDLASPILEPDPTLPAAALESDSKPEPAKRGVDSDQRKPSYDYIPDGSEAAGHPSAISTATSPSLSRASDDADALPTPTDRDIVGEAPPEPGIPEGGRAAVPAVDRVTEQLLNAVPFQSSQATGLSSVLHPPHLHLRGRASSLGRGDSRSGALERLYQLEEQLSAIESTAQAVEGEFRDSNRLLHTIDRLQAVSETQVFAPRSQRQPPAVPEESPNIGTPTPRITPPTPPEPTVSAQAHERVVHLPAEDPGHKQQPPSLPASPDGPQKHNQEQPPSEGGVAEGGSGGKERSTRDIPVERGEVASLARPSATPPHLQHQRDSVRASEDAGLRDTGDAGDGDVRGTEGLTGGPRAAASGPPAADDRRPSVPPPPPSAGSRSPPELRRKGHVQFSERLVKRRGTQIISGKPQEGADPQRKQDREEVREWMAAQRRERQVAHRAGLRSPDQKAGVHCAEKHPVRPSKTPQSSLAKLREERRNHRRGQEREATAKRIQEAFSLMNDLLTSKPEKPKASGSPTSRLSLPSSPRPLSSTARLAPSSSRAARKRPSVEFELSSAQAKRQAPAPAAARLPPSGRRSAGKSTAGSKKRSGRGPPAPGTLTETQHSPRVQSSTETTAGLASSRSSLRGTHSIASPGTWTGSGRIRKISSVEGLTEDEQEKLADILASTECEQHSLSSGSVASSINWEEVDRILDS